MDPKQIAKIIAQEIDRRLNFSIQKQWQRGVVQAIAGQTADVFIEGSSDPHPGILCVDSYRPMVGDKVLILRIGNSGANFVIVGRIDGIMPNWIAPTLLNSWVNYDTTIFNPAGYYKDSSGVVHLRGLIKNGTATTGTALLTLPAGYRPFRQEIITVTSVDLYGQIRIAENGNVTISVGSSSWLSLDGVTFRADK